MKTNAVRTTYSISYYCRKSKENKAGLAPLELCICINGERLFINLPVKFSSKEFNKKRKPAHIEDVLTQFRVKTCDCICDLMQQGLPISATNLKEYMRTGGVKQSTLKMAVTNFLSYTKKHTTDMVYRKYQIAMDFIMDVLGKDVEISTINVGMCNNLYMELKNKFMVSTAAGYMAKAKTLFQYCMDNGIIKINPANSIKITKGNPTIAFLTSGDIDKIKALDLDDYDRLNRVRDLLLFQCSTGMAYADLVQFDNNMVTEMNGVYTYTNNRQKTGIEFTTVILPMGMDVLKKYDGVLPLISNQKYNSYLKEIQRLAKINTTITTHLCRKTYAHNMLNNGVRIETVARLLGHSNTNITQRIYCRQTSETVASEVAQILN